MTEPSAFSVGGVLARGLDAVGRDPAGTLVPALLFGALPASLVGYAYDALYMDIVFALGEMGGELALFGTALVLGSVTNLLTQGAVTRAVLARSEGARASIRETTRPALRRLPALLLAGLVIGVATLFAGLLLIVPGLILFALWSVAGPVLIEEHSGVFGALRRSFGLWRSAPGRVLGLNVLLIVGYLLFSVLLAVTGVLLWQGPDVLLGDEAPPLPASFHIVSALPVAVASAVWAAVVAQLYAELRDRSGDESTDRLADIFA